jgi:hypothetical protein
VFSNREVRDDTDPPLRRPAGDDVGLPMLFGCVGLVLRDPSDSLIMDLLLGCGFECGGRRGAEASSREVTDVVSCESIAVLAPLASPSGSLSGTSDGGSIEEDSGGGESSAGSNCVEVEGTAASSPGGRGTVAFHIRPTSGADSWGLMDSVISPVAPLVVSPFSCSSSLVRSTGSTGSLVFCCSRDSGSWSDFNISVCSVAAAKKDLRSGLDLVGELAVAIGGRLDCLEAGRFVRLLGESNSPREIGDAVNVTGKSSSAVTVSRNGLRTTGSLLSCGEDPGIVNGARGEISVDSRRILVLRVLLDSAKGLECMCSLSFDREGVSESTVLVSSRDDRRAE